MLIKVDGMVVASLKGYAWTALMVESDPDVKEALEGRKVVKRERHPSGRSVNLITTEIVANETA